MSNREHLFNLIQSMSRTEKGYFKKMYADKGLARPNKYVELFDLIDNQKIYNEPAIVANFQNKGIFKQLSVAKNYLNTMILKSLRAYNSKGSVNVELNERMMNIEILFNKGLNAMVEKEIRKVEQMIDEHEAFHRFPELARWKKNLLDKTADQRLIGKLRQDLHEKEMKMIDKARVFAEISNLTFQLLSVYLKIGTVRNRSQFKEYQTVMRNPILRDESKLNSFSSWYYFHNIHSMYFDAIKDYNNFHYHTDCFVKLIEENPKHIERNPAVYVSSCFNRVLSLVKLQDTLGFEKALEHFKDISKKWGHFLTSDLERDMWIYESNTRMWQFRLHGEYAKMRDLGESVQNRSEEQIFIYPFSVLYSEVVYLSTYASFAIGEYKYAIKKLNLIINNSLREQREDIACYAMILNLMCHYELGNFDYVESSVRSTYRFLVKLEKIYAFEKALISFFRKLLKQNNLADLSGFMIDFRTKLEELEKDLYEKSAFEYVDLISWLSAHIENRPFTEVALERAKK
ncbi:MAG: hypothetical protein ACI85F_001985 [Bacteroidia bacterium]|jgi:hypothetical protein